MDVQIPPFSIAKRFITCWKNTNPMITIKETGQDNIVGFVLKGEVDEAGMKQLIEALDQRSDFYNKLRLYGEVYDIKGWETFKSLFSNIKAKFRAFRKLEKYAIVTDVDWLEDLTEIAGYLTPGLDVDTFDTDEKEEAIQWLLKPTREQTINVEEVTLVADNAIGFSIDGHLSKADYDLINSHMKAVLDYNDKIGLYLDIIDLDGMTLKAVWEEFKAAVNYYSRIEKVAITGQEGWLKSAAKISDFLTPGIDVRYFEEAEEAKNWLAN
jgi:hypothetical protein